MRIIYRQGARTIRLHGPTLTALIDQIPEHTQQEFAREVITPNMSGESFARIMRDKFQWNDLVMHECCGGSCNRAA